MNRFSKIIAIALTAVLGGCAKTPVSVQTFEPLALDLKLANSSNEKLVLVATLTNTSQQNVAFTLADTPNPLTVLVWSKAGHDLTHRIQNRLKSNYRQHAPVQVDAGETITISAEVDLTKYRDFVPDEKPIFVSAQYGWLQWQGGGPGLVYSNRVYLD